jgi:hypothetical protein
MNPGCAQGERRFAVRSAARAWKRAGLIDQPALEAIQAAYADDRQRVGTAIRVLLFVFAWIAVQSASGFFMMFTSGRGYGVIALVSAVFAAGATEFLRNSMRRARSGAEEATAFIAVGSLAGGLGWLFFETLPDERAITMLAATTAAASAIAAWRWGGVVFGLVAAGAVFFLLLRFDGARWSWLAVAALAVVPLLRLAESAALAPSQRRAAGAALVVAIAAAYAAVHYSLWEIRAFEGWDAQREALRESSMPEWMALAGTALLPFGLLAFGLGTRRRLLVDLGILTALVSIITGLVYWNPKPEWLVLVASGGLLIGLALGLRRWLDAGNAKERAGWTAEPLFEHPDRQSLVELAASLATLTPAARQQPAAPGFQGAGGEMGGGGASSSF